MELQQIIFEGIPDAIAAQVNTILDRTIQQAEAAGYQVHLIGMYNRPSQLKSQMPTPFAIAQTQEQFDSLGNEILEGTMYHFAATDSVKGIITPERVEFDKSNEAIDRLAEALSPAMHASGYKTPGSTPRSFRLHISAGDASVQGVASMIHGFGVRYEGQSDDRGLVYSGEWGAPLQSGSSGLAVVAGLEHGTFIMQRRD
jgi:hypothetical protein